MTPAKSGRPGMGGGEVFFEIAEKKQLPDFRFLGRGGIDVWRSQETGFCRKSTETIHLGGSTDGDL
jgi:hypothetical protein